MPNNHEELQLATKLVAGTYAGPHCVEAAALLVEVGDRLGYDLDPRPVSLFATTLTPDGNVATGAHGRAFGESYLARRGAEVVFGGEFDGGTPFQRQAGHMVVISREYSLLLDPTFAQFHQLGDQAVALFVSEAELKAKRFWQVSNNDLFARYFAADDYMESNFDLQRTAAAARADKIFNYIRLRFPAK